MIRRVRRHHAVDFRDEQTPRVSLSVYADNRRLALGDVSSQNRLRERRLEEMLHGALDRSRAHGGIVPRLAEEVSGIVGDVEADLTIGESRPDAFHLLRDDLSHLRKVERIEHDVLVHAIDDRVGSAHARRS